MEENLFKRTDWRWLLIILLAAAFTLNGIGIYVATNTLVVDAQSIPTPTPVNRPNTRLLSNTSYTQIVMKDNFTVVAWWDSKEHSAEFKAEDLGGGAHYKFDFPMRFWLAAEGRYPDGRWKFVSVPMDRPDMSPGVQFVPIEGTVLVWMPTGSDATPIGTLEPSPTSQLPTVTGTREPTTTPTLASTGTPIVIPYTPHAYRGSQTFYGNCDDVMPWSYLYNKVYDANGKILSADKVDCVTYAQLRMIQNLDVAATIDAGVPIITGTLRMVFPTHTPAVNR